MDVTILGSGDDGTTPCALLELGERRLLLNASEGLQRLASEHQLKLTRGLDAVLLCSLEPVAIAGLAGLLITLAKAGVGTLTVAGPPGVATLLSSLNIFARSDPMRVTALELEGRSYLYWHAGATVFALPVAGGERSEAEDDMAVAFLREGFIREGGVRDRGGSPKAVPPRAVADTVVADTVVVDI